MPRAQQESAGFTLLEVLVVIAILALVSGLAFPRIDQILAGAQFAEARSMVQGATRAARAEAIRTDSAVSVSVSTDGRFLLGNGRIIAEVPASIRIQTNGRGPIFFGDGSTDGGVLDVISKHERAELSVADGTGAIRWQ